MLSFCKAFKIYGHKHFEFQFDWLVNELSPFEFLLRLTTKRDHAGLEFRFDLFTLLGLYITIHDDRHWNYTANRWYNPGEEEAEWNGEFS